jgi:hypothetical protein
VTALPSPYSPDRARNGHDAPVADRADHLHANYWRVRGPDDLGSLQRLCTVTQASGCASLLPYVLLYEVDA